jgi:hypothetical protein
MAISLFASILSLATRYIILATVISPYVVLMVILVAICINLGAFFAASMMRKNYTGKAFGSSKDFLRKLLISVGTALVFSVGTSIALGQFLSGNEPIFIEIAGRSYTDNDVAIRYLISWLVLYAVVAIVCFLLIHGD